MQAANGRRITGNEAVTCTVTAPDGKTHGVPVALAEGGAHFQATLHWLQLGIYQVLACSVYYLIVPFEIPFINALSPVPHWPLTLRIGPWK